MGFGEFWEFISGGRTGKNPVSFWDFGRFGGVYSGSEGSWGKGDFGNLFLEDGREKIREFLGFRKVFGGVYSGFEGGWGKGDFGNLFLEDGREKIREFLGFRKVFFREEICTRFLGSGEAFDYRFPVAGWSGWGWNFRQSGSGGVFCGFSAQGGFGGERRQPAIAIVAESRTSTGQVGGRSVASPAGLDRRGACEGLERKARAPGLRRGILDVLTGGKWRLRLGFSFGGRI